MTFISYQEASEYQLREWCEGRPWHNPWAPDGSYGETIEDGECCPDFSCCAPDAIWAKDRRYAFLAASGKDREGMLLGALSGLLADEPVYIAGEKP